ncbi:MAG TPA: GTPase [Pirellulales bacterium]|nr:GTPase [Pirellulales bacterium]
MIDEPRATVVKLTPDGRGAVAVLLVEGGEAAELVGRHFFGHSPEPLGSRPLNRILHGHWGSCGGEDVVVCRRSATEVEIQCHGGSAAAERIVADLAANGCALMDWREWIGSRESSRIRADARALLANVRTERTAAILLDQYLGALDAALARIDGYLEADDANAAQTGLQALVAHSSVGLHLVEPWRVAIAGPPNVGKSSLINALVGYRRSIVFDQPGTTRDVVTVATAIDGWPIELSDTAGLRASDDALESAGVELARRQLAAADCVVLIFDVTERWTDECESLIQDYPAAIVVLNKVDLLPDTEPARGQFGGCGAPPLLTSAVTNCGIDDLAATLVRRVVSHEPQPGDAVPFTPLQVEQVRAALDAVSRGDLSAARIQIQNAAGRVSRAKR